jgi:formiminotetrahydrofolate cyclodeaminase
MTTQTPTTHTPTTHGSTVHGSTVRESTVQSSIEKFLDDLAGGNPTPGGGSAAAVMGAMGAALVSMVCNVTIGKKGYEGVEGEMRAILHESEKVRRRLTAMVAEDIAAFDSIMAAYKLPKASDDEKTVRAAAIQAGLRRATEVPLDCARVCAEVIGLSRRASEHGYLNVISDGGVGVLAGFTGLRSAALNVYINAPALKDRAFADKATADLGKLVEHCAAESEAVYALVRNKLG